MKMKNIIKHPKATTRKLTVLATLLVMPVLCVSIVTPAMKAFAAPDSCKPPTTTYGTDTTTMSVPATTSYTIWVQMQVPATSDSILLNVNGTNCYNVGGG